MTLFSCLNVQWTWIWQTVGNWERLIFRSLWFVWRRGEMFRLHDYVFFTWLHWWYFPPAKKGLKGTAEDLVRQRSPGTMIHTWILWVIYFVKETWFNWRSLCNPHSDIVQQPNKIANSGCRFLLNMCLKMFKFPSMHFPLISWILTKVQPLNLPKIFTNKKVVPFHIVTHHSQAPSFKVTWS